MKRRERGEDENGAPEGKRAAFPRRGESSDRPGAAASGQRLTTDDALTYLKNVKEKFKDDKEKYNEFLEVMKDFKAQKVDTSGVITRVKDLFKGHRKLILGFNLFLPRGYEITLPPEEDKKQPAVEFDQAINYVNKIKARFQTSEHVYKQFLEILNMYRKGNKTINEVYQEVAGLFRQHSDLLEEFTYFLPGTNGAPPPPAHSNPRPVHQQPPRQRDEKGVDGGVKSVSDRNIVVKKEKNPGMSGERSRERDPERRAEKTRKLGEKGEKKDLGDRKETIDREEGSRDMDKDFAELKPKRASARNASDAIRRQSQAGEGGEGFSGPAPQASTDDKRAGKGAAVQYPFFDKVKARLRSRDTYQEFLKCLNIFSQEIISRGELQGLVGDILGKHADLMEGFNEFLTHCENVEGYLAGVFSGRKLGDFSDGAPLKGVKAERDGERDRNREKDRERERDREREKEERDRERDVKEREREVKPAKGEGASHKVTSHKDKFMNKPISELDLSNCDRCTPSYRLLPKNYTKPVSSHRTALGNSVLNDHWVSVTSGSEDYSFKHMRKNQYEESLFRCEDDRFELDMLLESTAVTAKLVGEYTQKQDAENGKTDSLLPVEEFLSAINLRCIERIYGDHGLDILEVLKKTTSRAMPVVHSRLVQKEEEWTKCREDMNKVWAEVYAKNVYKALDHRSFYFKQQDKKALSTKALLAEIKEVNEKRRKKEDDTMLAISAGNRRLLVPDLRYEFVDASIHDDIYEIIKYSSEEISSSPDHTEKIMRMWRTFLEPMLGISSRAEGAEDIEEAAKSKDLEEEARDRNAVESGGGSEGDETSSPGISGGGASEGVGAVDKAVAAVGLDEPGAVDTNGDAGRAAVVGEGNGGDGSGVETAGTGEDDHGREGANEVGVRDVDPGAAEGTAARTEGSGWLQLENSGARQSSMAGEKEARSIGWQTESRVSRSVVVGGNGSGGRGTVEREEGELSPTSEQEDRNKMKSSPGRGVEEDGTVKIVGPVVEDGEGVGGTEMDHDHDGDDEAEESVPKTSEDSDNASEAGEVSASEQSADEHSEHEDAEDDDDQDGKAESEGEAEGMEDGDGDGTSSLDGLFAYCKPLATSSENFSVGSNSKKAGRVFYGNDLYYVLFRLHQTLYERILSAKVNAELAAKKKCSDDGAAPNLYAKFMEVLYGLLDGSVDNSKFEDECRALIGTQSYVLFTLDKLIFKLVKQLQAAATDDVALKLLALNAYERATDAVDVVYHANSCVLLHDESIYRFEHKPNPSELLIQLMDGGSLKHEISGTALESSFQSYLDEFLLSIPPRKNNRVFMMRCKKRNFIGDDEDEALQSALENAVVENGLENKMSCDTFKVSYVLDTADLFLRCTPRRAQKHKAKRELEKQRAFGEWLGSLNDSASHSDTSQVN